MKKKKRAGKIGFLVFVVLVISIIIIVSKSNEKSDMAVRAALLSEDHDLTKVEEDAVSYDEYLKEMRAAGVLKEAKGKEITVIGNEYTESTLNVCEVSEDGSVKTGDNGSISYEFDLKDTGAYYIEVGYYPTDDSNSAIIRNLYINRKIPFSEARGVTFQRMWKDDNKDFLMQTDKNQAFPNQVQKPEWVSTKLESSEKTSTGAYLFYLDEGKNIITFESVKSTLEISYIKLIPATIAVDYEEYLTTQEAKGAKIIDASDIDGGAEIIQAEDTLYKSSSTLLPYNDRTSSQTVPYHPSNIVLNTIGGSAWDTPGLSMTWEVTVPKTGLYKIASRFMQASNRDFYSVREVKINGEVPFEEAGNIKFYYDSKFQIEYFGNKEGAYYFYLKEGSNLLTMTVSLGDLVYAVEQTTISVKNFNNLYRRITAVTGNNPDKYRDYNIIVSVPDMVDILKTEYYRLSKVMESLDDTINDSTKTQEIAKMLILMEKLIQKPDEISTKLKSFNNYLTAISDWMLALGKQPLQLDYIMVCGENYKTAQAEDHLLQRLVHITKSFIGSFTNDYEVDFADTDVKEKSIDVWITSSLDQYEIAQRLVNNAFKDSDFGVRLKVVTADTVMPASLTGNGPDVVIQADYSMPSNFAFRGAAYDLTQFSDFKEVASRFSSGAMEFFEYQDGYYALPDQMSFPVMFCRTDILKEMGLEIPNTWDEMISLIPYLQAENMQIYFITDTAILGGTTSSTTRPGSCIFYSMLYQNGEELYRDGDRYSNIDNNNALLTFKKWTDFYTKQSFSVLMNVQTRFRTGQTPIIIADYTMVNTINVAAPEIDGDWTIAPLPGTLKEDGTIDRSTTCMVGSSIILKNEAETNDTVGESWEFLKWWSSEETQLQYAQGLKAVLGDAANYPASNVNAAMAIAEELGYEDAINETLSGLRGIPQVPGGYITGRNIENAFLSVVNDKLNPVDTLYSKIRYINTEMKNKRKEFGLDD